MSYRPRHLSTRDFEPDTRGVALGSHMSPLRGFGRRLALRRSATRALVLCLSLSLPAMAQTGKEPDPDPLSTIEEELRSLRQDIETLKVAEEQQARTPDQLRRAQAEDGTRFLGIWGYEASGSWRHGIELNLVDPYDPNPKQRVVHRVGIHGRVHLDYHLHSDQHHPTDDTFLFRRARIGSKGFLFRYLGYAVDADFSAGATPAAGAAAAQGATPGKTKLKNAFVNLQRWKTLQLKLGHFKTPMGLEALNGGPNLNFAERPMVFGTLGIDRDMGAMLHGDLTYASYQLALLGGQDVNTRDNSDDKDVVARVQLSPFSQESSADWREVLLGASFSTGHRRDFIPEFETQAGTEWLAPNVTGQQGQVSRAGGELFVTEKTLRLQAEYLYMRVADLSVRGRSFDLSVHGWYVDLGYMLTGETRRFNKRLIPLANLDLEQGGFGALEAAVRFERLDVESAFARAATRGTGEVDSFSLGLSWYPNPYLRVMAGYQRVMFSEDTGVAGVRDNEDVFFFRLALGY
ncbi:OprO/OprP family phosphate-selective porin [Planctomycetota bacterium]